jgi:FAD dependent oxidoreductase TIGR03364
MSVLKHFDVAVVGGGIVGLAHAWMAARRGLSVVVCERSAAARGASVRNFGMVWPIGQPAGELQEIALRSRDLWLELHTQGAVQVEECGSIHLAHHADELAVLEEFCALQSHSVTMLTAGQVQEKSALANPDGLQGGMYSDSELRVDPRTASARIAEWLQSQLKVDVRFRTQVTAVTDGQLSLSDGTQFRAERTIVCSNDDLVTLFPEVLQNSGLTLCKLQMLKVRQTNVTSGGVPHIASGLTLRHYTAFAGCPSLQKLKQRIAGDSPELDEFGIHVMASQFPNGDVVLGDSHEYDERITPFNSESIDDLILRELRKVIRMDNWNVTERWFGVYAKHPEQPVVSREVQPGCHVFVGTGGAGMTMAFGLADHAWRNWQGESDTI